MNNEYDMDDVNIITEFLNPPPIDNLDKFVKITDAARILGYSSFISVNKMIKDGHLTGYQLPNHKRKRVLMSDLNALSEKEKDQSKNTTSTLPKKSSGRPRRFGT